MKDLTSVQELLSTIEVFSSFAGLNSSLGECKVPEIGPLKEGHSESLCCKKHWFNKRMFENCRYLLFIYSDVTKRQKSLKDSKKAATRDFL